MAMATNDTLRDRLRGKLTRLHLGHMAEHLDQVLDQDQKESRSFSELLLRLLEIEIAQRDERLVRDRIKKARLSHLVTIDAFDFDFHPSRKKNKTKILGLLDLEFIRQKSDLILLGNPGVGKTFIMECIALAACRAKLRVHFTTVMDMLNVLLAAQKDYTLGKKLAVYRNPDVLCLDELGYLSLDRQGADLLFQVLSNRSGRASTLITTNKPFKDWGDILGSATLAAALADRLVANCEVIILQRSFRSKETTAD